MSNYYTITEDLCGIKVKFKDADKLFAKWMQVVAAAAAAVSHVALPRLNVPSNRKWEPSKLIRYTSHARYFFPRFYWGTFTDHIVK